MARELIVRGDHAVEVPLSPYVGDVRVTVIKADAEDQDPLRGLLAGQDGEKKDAFLEPLYDPGSLIRLYERSASLRPNIAAMAMNIDACGHMFEPAVKLGAPDSLARLKEAIFVDRLMRQADASPTDPKANTQSLEEELAPYAKVPEPTDEEVGKLAGLLQRLALVEYQQLRTFFAICCAEMSFVELRVQTRHDLETTGNGYWEATRDQRGVVARFVKMPTETVLMTPVDDKAVTVEEKVRSSDLSWKTVTQQRSFRRYAQFAGDVSRPAVGKRKPCAWFKEFGDPRVLSRKTGVYFPDPDALHAKEGSDAIAASEVLHFRVYTPASPYGGLRWGGNIPGVLGSRELDEINEAYFDNNAVPPLALLVSGGRLAKGVTNRFKEMFESKKGLKNFHRMVIIEAEAAPSTSNPVPASPNLVPKLSFERLRDVQLEDGLFQVYDQRNTQKLDASFRIPATLKGASPELAALRQTETQVFAPERASFDEVMNRRILPELGIRLWRFRSNGPSLQDHEAMGRLIVDLTNGAAIRPDEARDLASVLLQKDLVPIDEDWAKRPLALTLAMIRAMSGPAEAVRVGEGLEESAEAVRQVTVGGARPAPKAVAPVALPERRRNGSPTPRGDADPEETKT